MLIHLPEALRTVWLKKTTVEFLLRISVPSLPARRARRCTAELPAVHRRAVNVHHECNTTTIRENSSDAASDC